MKSVGLQRDTIDKFYTKTDVANTCITYIKEHLSIHKKDLIIEPSAGNGSFIEGIKTLSDNYLFYDISPENPEIEKTDFLQNTYHHLRNKHDKIHIVGNPPFGRQATLAIKFIKKCCEFSDSISFVVPKSFKKESMQKAFSLCFHKIFEIDLPEKCFMINGKEYTVPCIFQIWEKKDTYRNISQKLEPKNFIFVKKDEKPDISFRRVGVNAGTIDTNISSKSIQSHYFIKFINQKDISENIKRISSIKYPFNNTVGPKSISKQELIREFNIRLYD